MPRIYNLATRHHMRRQAGFRSLPFASLEDSGSIIASDSVRGLSGACEEVKKVCYNL